jgi:hypothetical protein
MFDIIQTTFRNPADTRQTYHENTWLKVITAADESISSDFLVNLSALDD